MKYCTNCGTQLEGNESFCPNCGTPVNAQPAPQPAPQQQTVYAQPAPQPAPQTQTVYAQPAPQPAPQVQTVYAQPAQPAQPAQTERKFTGLQTAAFVFMILSTVAMGWTLIPLAWCIPMTVSYYNCIKQGRPVSMGLKICTLLFVNLLSGIFMLADNSN